MPAFSSHHCPKCGRVGNKRCVANGHYADCEIHPGSFHSIYTECVKCTNLKQIQEQEQRAALERMKEGGGGGDERKNQKKKKAKTPKAKLDCEKSMKQLRKEEKERRKTGGSDQSSPW